MAIKRRITTIEELDDSPDQGKETSIPEYLLPKGISPSHRLETTNVPSKQEDYGEAENPALKSTIKETVGRTPSDLVYLFINKPEFMATIIIMFAFFICINKIHRLSDFWLPGSITICISIVWFGLKRLNQNK